MRQFLYDACVDGLWPVQYIEGFKNWETGPIRFFYDDFKQSFHAWCKRSGIALGGTQRRYTKILLTELTETFPAINARLRCTPGEGSLVHRSPSDGRARAFEIPSLSVCRKNFDCLFKGPQDWNGVTAPAKRETAASVKLEKAAKRNAHFRPGYEVRA
jgi:hypothetical protein